MPSPSQDMSKSRPCKEDIIQMMEDFDRSESVTVKEFCEIHEIDASTFRDWHNIYEHRGNHSERSGFMALEVESPNVENPNRPTLFAEVHGIKLYREVSAEYLKALLP